MKVNIRCFRRSHLVQLVLITDKLGSGGYRGSHDMSVQLNYVNDARVTHLVESRGDADTDIDIEMGTRIEVQIQLEIGYG